jgi:hypothetical protein
MQMRHYFFHAQQILGALPFMSFMCRLM